MITCPHALALGNSSMYCHFHFDTGQSFLVLMCSDGFVNMYSLPELKLVCKEDCVDASDAFGQRNFTMTSRGLFVHLRSPSEFTRGSVTEQARVALHFTIPNKSTSKLALTHSTPSKDPICEVSIVSLHSYESAKYRTMSTLYTLVAGVITVY